MAQLEIHDSAGNVTYAEVSEDKPILIGSGSNCGVVLKSADVAKVHCRVAFRDSRWRIEVAQDASPVELKGKKVKAGTITGGDMIGIEDCQIYFDDGEDGAGEEAAEDSFLDGAGFDEDLTAPPVEVPSSKKKKLVDKVVGDDLAVPPGEEKLLRSRLVHILLVVIVVVATAGIFFYNDFQHRVKTELFDTAVKFHEDGNFETAIRLFNQFEETYPSDRELAGICRVRRSVCEIELSTVDPRQALALTDKMLNDLSKEKSFSDNVQKAGEILRSIATKQATTAASRVPKDLKEIENFKNYLQLCEEVETFLAKRLPGSDFPEAERQALIDTKEKARALIKKADVYETTFANMTESLEQATAMPSYEAYDRLYKLYTDQANRPEILELLANTTSTDRDAVAFNNETKAAITEERGNPFQATTVLADRVGTMEEGDGIVFSLAGGTCYAVSRGGKVLWHRDLGIDSRWLPQRVEGASTPTVIAVDTRYDELVALNEQTGELIWRLPVGEPVLTPPLVHRGRLYQPTGIGRLYVITADSGRVMGHLTFQSEQRLANTPAVDRSGQFLFLLGERFSLYVLSLGRPPKCESVFYLGHKRDTVAADLLRQGRYVAICENHDAQSSRIRVLLISTDGKSLKELTPLPMAGWITHVPSVSGNLMIVANDLENVTVYSAGPPEKSAGFKRVKGLQRDATGEGPRGQAYALAYTDRHILVAGLKVRLYSLDIEESEIKAEKELLGGSTSQPIQRYPIDGATRQLFVAQRLPNSSAVQLTGLDASELNPQWSLLLGGGLLSLTPADESGNELVALTLNGRVFRVASADLSNGGVLDRPVGRVQIGEELAPERPTLLLENGETVYTPRGEPKHLVVRPADLAAEMRRVTLPVTLSADAKVFKQGILVPGTDGRLYWVDSDGKELSEPFQPEIGLDKPPTLRGVAVNEQGRIIVADDKGMIYQVELQTEPVASLRGRQGFEVNLAAPVQSDIATSGNIFCFVDANHVMRALDSETLDEVGKWQLPGAASLGPATSSGYIAVVSGREEVVCIDAKGELVARHKLDGRILAGQPLVKDGMLYLAGAAGEVEAVKLADGSTAWSEKVDKPLASGIVSVQDLLVVAGADGSLNVLKVPGD